MGQIDLEKLDMDRKQKMGIEVGEWIARRLMENNELIKTLPPILYAYYKTWLDFCRHGYYSRLYEEEFKGKLIP